MKASVFLTGTNCSGKTSLTKALFKRETPQTIRFGEGDQKAGYTYMPQSGIALPGTYYSSRNPSEMIACGGADSITDVEVMKVVMRKFQELHNVEVVWMEGLLFTPTHWKLLEELWPGVPRILVTFNTPVEVCLDRVTGRSGKKISDLKHSGTHIYRKYVYIADYLRRIFEGDFGRLPDDFFIVDYRRPLEDSLKDLLARLSRYYVLPA